MNYFSLHPRRSRDHVDKTKLISLNNSPYLYLSKLNIVINNN